VILLDGFPGNVNSPYGLAERLTKGGINILVFNYEGSFNSEGIFSFENCMNDIGVAIDFLKQKKNIQQYAIKALETDHYFTNKRDELAKLITEWIKNK